MQAKPVLSGVSPVQVVYIDAAKAALDMIEVAYDRLRTRLGELDDDQRSQVEEMADAWTIVDNAYRLNVLLRQFPGMKQKSEPVLVALTAFKMAEPLRHAVQHMNREIHVTAAKNRNVWGEIAFQIRMPDGEIRVYLQTRNPYGPEPVDIIVPAAPPETDYSKGVAFIHLLVNDLAINLSQIAESAANFDVLFIRELQSAYQGQALEAWGTLRLFTVTSDGST